MAKKNMAKTLAESREGPVKIEEVVEVFEDGEIVAITGKGEYTEIAIIVKRSPDQFQLGQKVKI